MLILRPDVLRGRCSFPLVPRRAAAAARPQALRLRADAVGVGAQEEEGQRASMQHVTKPRRDGVFLFPHNFRGRLAQRCDNALAGVQHAHARIGITTSRSTIQ